ncbi:MAG: hypothetical protein KTR24_02365 [Saprospiraceae bacterium]|nr:hypothetical protein [Saprospiraceae bacterium]
MVGVRFVMASVCMVLLILSCEKEPSSKEPPNNDKAIFLVVNFTGHNAPHQYCGNELEATFFISSPKEQLEVIVGPDHWRQIALDIEPGEVISVSAMETVTQKPLVEKSSIFTGSRTTETGDVNLPAVFLCPKDHLRFAYW